MRGAWWTAILLVAAACRLEDRSEAVAGDAQVPPDSYGIGTPLAATSLAAFDTDVSPSGEGLPAGSGDDARGATLYRQKCALCHGANGEGVAPNPPLVGREPREGFPFGREPNAVRTIGNYWPHATTVFDYVKRTMPLDAPGSLTDDEVYSLTAWLLVANEILPAGSALDSARLVAVRMPAVDRFVPDDRKGGREVR